MKRYCTVLMVAAGCLAWATTTAGAATIDGTLKTWHRVTVSFEGPETSESAEPSPFLHYRLNVTFTGPWDSSITVPGFYAADGHAADSGSSSGSTWRVRFCPPEPGVWKWRASFRRGDRVALAGEPHAGSAAAFDGASGSFTVKPSEKDGRDFRGRGRLRYVGERYLRFAGTGEPFLKGGADSPENFLAYEGFDGTPPTHAYAPHLDDWREGDPTWAGNRGKGIIGALNYLAGKGMNSVYMLTMNVTGDGRDVWPWTAKNARMRFDCSKLAQWEIVFSHMDRLGLMQHFVTQETENDHLLDDGELGPQRKLYYRELVARFAHHPAITWNLGEENTNTDEQRKRFARYIRGLIPYRGPFLVVHTYPQKKKKIYEPLLGFRGLGGPALQMGNPKGSHSETIRWLERSREAGHPWVVCVDEIGPASTGVMPDGPDSNQDMVRRRVLWANLMAGGAGCEWFFGYDYPHNDLDCEDWSSRSRMWDFTRHALRFFHRHLPFAKMRHADDLTSAPDDYCLARPGEVYAIYLPEGGSTKLDLGDSDASFQARWYNPREGGELRRGSVTRISGPGQVSLGPPPDHSGRDWAILVERRTQ